MTDVYKRLAEDDGARFHKGNESDRWMAEDSDGIAIVSGAMSVAEAARLYCEDKGLTSPGEILDRIVATYRPYYVLEEFWQGLPRCVRSDRPPATQQRWWPCERRRRHAAALSPHELYRQHLVQPHQMRSDAS
jgi:hypothetical protein